MIDINLFCKNIRFLANKNDKKLGELEKDANVSVGYTSRLAKDDSGNIAPVLSLAIEAAKEFNVTIDSLLFLDFSNMTPNELYLSSFASKLVTDTRAHKFVWTKESKNSFDEFYYREAHPLFELRRVSECDEDYKYHSLFNVNYEIKSDSFYVKLINNKYIYLMNVWGDMNDSLEGDNKYELYFVEDTAEINRPPLWNIIPVCYIDNKSPLFSIFNDLYNSASDSSRHIKIDDSAKNIIDDFMNDMPF